MSHTVATQSFRAQFAIVGASNVTKGLRSIVSAMALHTGGPFRACVTAGLGRSYGLESSILARGLPSIHGCQMWDCLDAWRSEVPELPSYALVADVGNDVAYGVPTARIARWFETTLRRLDALGFRVVTTGLPLQSLRALDPLRFAVMTGLLFPERRLEYDESLHRATEVDRRIRSIAAERDVPCGTLLGSWYGLDPIHILRRHRASAWRELTAPWSDGSGEEGIGARGSKSNVRLRRSPYLMRPAEWTWAGEPRRTQQPATRLSDGSELWLW